MRLELHDMMPAPSTVACLQSVLADQRMSRPLHSQGVLPRLSKTLFLFGASHSPAPRPESKDPTPFLKWSSRHSLYITCNEGKI